MISFALLGLMSLWTGTKLDNVAQTATLSGHMPPRLEARQSKSYPPQL